MILKKMGLYMSSALSKIHFRMKFRMLFTSSGYTRMIVLDPSISPSCIEGLLMSKYFILKTLSKSDQTFNPATQKPQSIQLVLDYKNGLFLSLSLVNFSIIRSKEMRRTVVFALKS